MKKLLLGVVIFTMGQLSLAQTAVYQEKSLLGLAQDLHLGAKSSMKGASVILDNVKPVYLQIAAGEKSVEIQTIFGAFQNYGEQDAVNAHLANLQGQSLPVNILSQTSKNTTEVKNRTEVCVQSGHHDPNKLVRSVTTTSEYRNTQYVFSFVTVTGLNYQFKGYGKYITGQAIQNGPCVAIN